MRVKPFTFGVEAANAVLDDYDNHIERYLSNMKGMFADTAAYDAAVQAGNPKLYDVYELHVPEVAGELLHGLSVLHPGLIGDEYYMTKGHFHTVLETGEIYYCLRGRGVMVMETPEGDWAVEPLNPIRCSMCRRAGHTAR